MQDREIKGPICLQNHEKETELNHHQDLPKTTRYKSLNISASKANLMETIYLEPDSKNPYLETLEEDTENLWEIYPEASPNPKTGQQYHNLPRGSCIDIRAKLCHDLNRQAST